MSTASSSGADHSAGVFYAGLSYVLWGLMPLYWRVLGDVPPFELTVHRVLWCAVFVAGVTLARGRLPHVLAIFRKRALVASLALTSLLIGVNWTLYIYCIATGQLVEASLGYYMTPLLSFALGYLLFAERISRLRAAAIGCAGLAVVVQFWGLDHLPWIAPSLAITFAFYGYFRKRTPVAAMDGLLIETALLFPFMAGLVAWWAGRGGAFPSAGLAKDALLIGAGPMTAIPLALFAAGARRITLSTLGFLQYLSPSITLLLAIFGFHEPFTAVDAVSFGCVWLALALVAVETAGFRFRAGERNRPSP
jgi:chloramphenicol-sensitive protein RarD